MIRQALMGLVKGYRFFLSPWLGSACRFEPTCSVYALGALQQHGAGAGSYLTLRRLVRCQPWCAGGHDPVPDVSPRLFSSGFTQATQVNRRLTLGALRKSFSSLLSSTSAKKSS